MAVLKIFVFHLKVDFLRFYLIKVGIFSTNNQWNTSLLFQEFEEKKFSQWIKWFSVEKLLKDDDIRVERENILKNDQSLVQINQNTVNFH